MTLAEIVRSIHQIIATPELARDQKIARLIELANAYWQTVFPERGSSAYETLSDQEKRVRWAEARQRSGLESFENRQQLLYVLDWPGSNGNFYWVQ